MTGLLISINTYSFAENIIKNNLQFQDKIKTIELDYGGKIGLTAIDIGNNKSIGFNSNKRFPMCSTFKFMLVAAILKKSMNEPGLLEKRIHYNKSDVISTYSPYTKQNIPDGMTVSELCQAAMLSDNTAANILIHEVGGIAEVNHFAQSIGDESFRLDRIEPDLNTAIPGDPRDTSTPQSMATSIQKIGFSNVLSLSRRTLFLKWLKNNTTGINRIKAGVPEDWIVGDKTGTCSYGTTNDVGIVWPKNCSPIIISIFYTQPDKNKDAKPKDIVIQEVTKLTINHLIQNDKCLAN